MRKAQPYLALLVSIAVAALASGCGDKKEVLTPADVRKAFAHQGLSLEAMRSDQEYRHWGIRAVRRVPREESCAWSSAIPSRRAAM